MNPKHFIVSFLLLPLLTFGQLNLQPDSVISVNVVWDRDNMNTQGELGGGDTLVFEVPENSIWKLNHWGLVSPNSAIKASLLTKKTISVFGNSSSISDLTDGDFLWLASGDKIIVYNSFAVGYWFNGNCSSCFGLLSLNALQFKTQ